MVFMDIRRTLAFLLTALLILILDILFGATSQTVAPDHAVQTATQTQPSATTTALVTRVIDGDTIELEGGEHVRYIGINTPELAHGDQMLECFSEEARLRNEALVLGKHVTLVRDVRDRDKYGRLLRYVFVGDTLVNETLVRDGFAYATSYPPDVTRQEILREAERAARMDGRGLWSSCPR